jgi:hypothetical protein
MSKSTKQLASAYAYERIASTKPAYISVMNPQHNELLLPTPLSSHTFDVPAKYNLLPR